MTTEASIDIDAPAQLAYELWSDLERFPEYFGPVEEVTVLDDDNARWRVQVAGKEEVFESLVTERIPGKRLAWTAFGSVEQSGVVTFHRLDDERSRITLQLDIEDGGVLDRVAEKMGLLNVLVNYDLGEFKAAAEQAHRPAA